MQLLTKHKHLFLISFELWFGFAAKLYIYFLSDKFFAHFFQKNFCIDRSTRKTGPGKTFLRIINLFSFHSV